MELRQYLQIVWKWLWLIALGTLLAAGVSYWVSSLLPPVYRASTSLLVRAGGLTDSNYSTVIASEHLATTYKELLTKHPVIEAAARTFDLDPRQTEKKVQVRLIPNTPLIELTVEDNDPRLAMELANEIVSVFVQTQRKLGSGRDIFVVEPATQPLKPTTPRKLLNTLVAAVGGFVLVTGTVFLIEYLDDTLGTAEDINQSLSLPMLAAIPRPNRRQKRNTTPITVADSTSSLAEAYRTLCARIQFSNGNSRLMNGRGALGTMLITSPLSRNEKASIAVNLAVVMAQAGLKVLLVDADLRQPQLHQVFGLTNEIGLTTLLAGNGDCRECIARTDISNLCVLSSGPPPLEPSVSSSQQMTQLIEQLGTQADVVLFDAPPVLTVADAMVLASQVEGTILVVESRSTQHEVAMQAMERLRSVQAKMLGVVLNKVRDKQYGHRENKHKW